MDWDRIEGNWKQMKGKVKEQWGKRRAKFYACSTP